MSIGRTFKESMQKALRSLEIDRFGFGSDGKIKLHHNLASLSEDERILSLEKNSPTLHQSESFT
jgi:carbamoyl-phosphate synthase large subunit